MNSRRHPGIVLSRRLAARDLTVTDAAPRIGVGRQNLSRVLNGHFGITAVAAVRLERAGFGPAWRWVALQAGYDLMQAYARLGAPK